MFFIDRKENTLNIDWVQGFQDEKIKNDVQLASHSNKTVKSNWAIQ